MRWHPENLTWLFVLKTAYKEFVERVGQSRARGGAKTKLIEAAVNSFGREFTITELERACPGTSLEMVRRVFRDLQKQAK